MKTSVQIADKKLKMQIKNNIKYADLKNKLIDLKLELRDSFFKNQSAFWKISLISN